MEYSKINDATIYFNEKGLNIPYNKIYSVQEFKKMIVLEVARFKFPDIRKRKYELHYYYDHFIDMNDTVQKWSKLPRLNTYKPINIKKSSNPKRCTSIIKQHWKCIYNEFCRWSNNNVFKDAHDIFMRENYYFISNIQNNKIIKLFIDVTKISNKRGSENVGVNTEYMKKNITEIQSICDQFGHILLSKPININTINKNYIELKSIENNQEIIYKIPTGTTYKTFKHELTDLQDFFNDIPLNTDDFTINKNDKIDILVCGDKAYTTDKIFKVMNKDVKIIVPKRKLRKKTKIQKVKDELKSLKIEKKNEKKIIKEENKKIKQEENIHEKENKYKNKLDKKREILELKNKKIKKKKIDIEKELQIDRDRYQHKINEIKRKNKENSYKNTENKKIKNDKKIKKDKEKQIQKEHNQERKNNLTSEEEQLLGNKHIIENCFARQKMGPRIYVRFERKIKNYMQFFYMTQMDFLVSSFLKKYAKI